ncbi:MAG: hypothetical protein HY305_00900 [Sphingobacteriales bacterium]|nr:hypothetical protein [Sphingobacteriales bacterium]
MLIFFSCFIILPVHAGHKQKKKQKHTKHAHKKTAKQKILYGKASFYSNKFKGRRTANGEIFRQKKDPHMGASFSLESGEKDSFDLDMSNSTV